MEQGAIARVRDGDGRDRNCANKLGKRKCRGPDASFLHRN
jgi:hypothetical protein